MSVSRREFLRTMTILVGATAAAGIAGCAPPAPAPQPTSAPKPKELTKTTLRLNWAWSGEHAHLVLGVNRGYWRDEGIDLELKEGNGSVNVGQLVGNKSDPFGLVDAAAIMPAISKGLPIKCVGMVSPRTALALIARQDSGIKTLKDVEGKTIALTAGDSLTQLWPAVVAANNLDASKIKLVYVDAAAKAPTVLEKKADATLAGVSVQFTIEAQGVPALSLLFADYKVNVLNLGIWVHPDTLKEKPDLVRAFLRGLRKTMEAAKKEPEATIDAFVKIKPELDRATVAKQVNFYFTQFQPINCADKPYGYNCPADWQQTMDIMKKYTGFETTMKTEDFFTNEFQPA